MRYDRVTRSLHAAVALGVILQLILSQLMEIPSTKHKVEALPLALFGAHEYIGLALLILLLLHWLWSLPGHVQGGIAHLFPWFSRERINKVLAQTRGMLKFQLPDPEGNNALAGAVHGLGLLIASVMAATGTVVFFNLDASGHMNVVGKAVAGLHANLATFMWIYLIGHAAMALLHVRMGHGRMREMFALFK